MEKSIDKIVTARDYGNGSAVGYLKILQKDFHDKRGIDVNIVDIDKPQGPAVPARIWQSQWIADCPDCNTAMFVDPDEPIFFCFGCGNRANGKIPRPVQFPTEAERKEIERLLLERPVENKAGVTILEQVALQRPLLVVEIEEIDPMAAIGKLAERGAHGVLPDLPKRKKLVRLSRSWRPGKSVAALEAEQRDAIEAWRSQR